jgi:hypothetical protein
MVFAFFVIFHIAQTTDTLIYVSISCISGGNTHTVPDGHRLIRERDSVRHWLALRTSMTAVALSLVFDFAIVL